MPLLSGSLPSHPSPKERLPIISQLYSALKTGVSGKWALSPRHSHTRELSASPVWKVGARPLQDAVLLPPAASNLGANCPKRQVEQVSMHRAAGS